MRLHFFFRWATLTVPIIAFTIPDEKVHQPDETTASNAPSLRPVLAERLTFDSRPLVGRQCGNVAVGFSARVTTLWRESVTLVGSIAALGSWNSTSGVNMSAAQYTAADPIWSVTISLSPGTTFQYKYIRLGSDGGAVWEADPNHSYTVPNDCKSGATVSDVWQTLASTSATEVSRTTTTQATRSTTTASLTPSASCTNGPSSRDCWSDGLSIETDFDRSWPTTGRTVSYDFTITNTTLAPDGYRRQGFAINGQFPGPTVYANWGDMIEVTIHNQMSGNGTNVHWHGMRMYHSNDQDGVPGVTECPIAPGRSKTYRFQATQYGTSWYHSHFSSQYGDGVSGPIVIYGPASANYDEDLGPLPMQDWYYPGIFATSLRAMHENALAPIADNGLINGTMLSASGGAYAQTILKAEKKHRLRLINTAVDNNFAFSLDGHIMTVIAADFVPIVPYNASWIFIGIGQRYDVIISADQAPASYWFRAEVQDTAGCGSNFQNGNIRSIFSYEGHEKERPSSSATSYTKRCTDETQIVSYWNSYVPRGRIPSTFERLDAAINQSTADDGTLTLYWQVNGTPLRVDWSTPTLSKVRAGNTSYGSRANLIELPNEGVWTYWVITEGNGSPFNVNIPHPIHLHGHDFYVLGWGTRSWTNADADTLNYNNPPRRDVAMLPANGWVAVAFYTDNPGAWLMHCHIAWHADDGFAVQFLESKERIFDVSPLPSDYDSQCDAWDSYYPSRAAYLQTDSGI